VSCPEERVVAFLAGDLPEDEERFFDEHLLGCEGCWHIVQVDRGARLALDKLREPAPAGLEDRVTMSIGLASRDSVPPHRVHRARAAHRMRMALRRPQVGLMAAACVLLVAAGGTMGWVVAQHQPQPADPPQVAAVASMMSPGSPPTKALRAGEHVVVAGQPFVVRAYETEGTETIVATSARPFPVPRSSHLLSGSSSKAWMATKGKLAMYGVNRAGGEQSMFLVSAMPMAELPGVAAHLHLI
jgi:hypothetical protein